MRLPCINVFSLHVLTKQLLQISHYYKREFNIEQNIDKVFLGLVKT